MAVVLVVLPPLYYDQVKQGDLTALEKMRVLPYATPQEVAATREKLLREDLEDEAMSWRYEDLAAPGRPPQEPSFTLSQLRDEAFVAKRTQEYERALAAHEASKAGTAAVQAFLDGQPYSSCNAVTAALLWETYCEGFDEEALNKRCYSKEVEA